MTCAIPSVSERDTRMPMHREPAQAIAGPRSTTVLRSPVSASVSGARLAARQFGYKNPLAANSGWPRTICRWNGSAAGTAGTWHGAATRPEIHRAYPLKTATDCALRVTTALGGGAFSVRSGALPGWLSLSRTAFARAVLESMALSGEVLSRRERAFCRRNYTVINTASGVKSNPPSHERAVPNGDTVRGGASFQPSLPERVRQRVQLSLGRD